MKMTFRWYGEDDSVTLENIKQIPNVTGVVSAIYDIPVGEVWPIERIQELKKVIHNAGLELEVIESVPVHEDIKLKRNDYQRYIDNYKETIRNLAKCGIKCICYNFMPIFDWTRTDLYKEMEDGSNALFYQKDLVTGVSPQEISRRIIEGAGDKTMPGWEPERLSRLNELFEEYKDITEEKLLKNFKYFLERVIPICEEVDVKLAVHPDDPPWPIFGLPRVVRDEEHIEKVLKLVDSPYNGLTLCSGSLGPNLLNDIPKIIRKFGDRIYFGHVRNVKVFENGDFIESSHRACDGNVDIVEVMKAYHDINFDGYIRPDHGRHLWGEEKYCRPGYGLYDRAMGVMYLLGIWDTLEKKY